MTVVLLVVPATMCTGEVTAAPFEGVQMVTEGLAVLSGQGAADADTVEKSIREKKEKIASNDFPQESRMKKSLDFQRPAETK